MASRLAEISNLEIVFPDGWTKLFLLNAQRILRVCYRGSARSWTRLRKRCNASQEMRRVRLLALLADRRASLSRVRYYIVDTVVES